MRAHFGYSLVSLLALGLAACGGDDEGGGSGGAPGGGGSAATGGSGGTGGAAGAGGGAGAGGSTGGSAGSDGGAFITVSGTVTEFQVGAGTPKPLADVQLCPPTPTPPCVKTDANGAYSVSLPANTEGLMLLTKTGYANVAIVGTTGSTDLTLNAVMPTTAVAQTFATAAGFAWPLASKSIIGFGVQEQVASDAGADAGMSWVGVAGATVAIAPVQGKGPVYLGANSLPDTAATSTSSAGAGFFGDLPPGDYQLKITAPSGKTCQRGEMQGWAGPSADSIKVPAVPGYVVSAVRFTCQ